MPSGGRRKPTRRKLLVLDTNHYSELERKTAACRRLVARLDADHREKALTIATVEEQIRGWLAEINRQHDCHRQIVPYTKLHRQVESLSNWIILPWDHESADLLLDFRAQRIRIGTMDLKIASIAIAHDATLLTRNTADFAQVPGLRFENWLD